MEAAERTEAIQPYHALPGGVERCSRCL